MAPTRPRKRPSGPTPSPRPNQTTVPTKNGTPTRTPHNRSPIKKTKPGLTMAQKQALIDNLQLEITERARRLRAQYNLQAQGLRSRIEIRVNRIPISLRRMTMGDLMARHERDGQRPAQESRPPPVPAKDVAPQPAQRAAYTSPYKAHAYKNSSDELAGPGKENDSVIENPKRRARAANAPAQILSPASSNSRLVPAKERPGSPTKSLIARPASPAKPATAHRPGLLSSMVEKAKATRGGTSRKATTSSTASSNAPAPAPRTKRAGAGPTRTTARAARRVSVSSNASTETTSTVVRKVGRPPARKPVPAPKKATGAAAKKAPTKAPATTGTGRVLRNRRG